MSIREGIRQRPAVGVGVFVGLCMLGVAIWWFSRETPGAIQSESGRIWMTTDDGKTWFPEDGAKIPPVMINGKEAVRCHVFTNDGGKTKYALYLERMQPAAKKKMDNKSAVFDPMAQIAAIEVKKPGDAAWVLRSDPKAMQIIDPKQGSEPVYPD
jgi:hypothetical protein